ncbi:MAG: dual specificity protein phosphatase family protein, partial [Thermodesulfobacteriota bacterium]
REPVRNVRAFYEEDLPLIPRTRRDDAYFSFVHGDLNGANIILDGRGNVWLIDFFHTRHGHVLQDLAKLENDLLYIFTPLDSEEDFREALELSDLLVTGRDLSQSPPDHGFAAPALARAYRTVKHLRGYYPDLVHEAAEPLQLLLAQVRYAVHTLSFDESSRRQKEWALYSASRAAMLATDLLWPQEFLRIDWLPEKYTRPGAVGLTLLPGRFDDRHNRVLSQDLDRMLEYGVTHVVCLATSGEIAAYRVPNLLAEYRGRGLTVVHQPIPDLGVCTRKEMDALVKAIVEAAAAGGRVMVHCLGGLGRAGTVAACFLIARGLSPEEAIREIRRARSPRAIETGAQTSFVREYQRPKS